MSFAQKIQNQRQQSVSMKKLHEVTIGIQVRQDPEGVTVYAEGRAIVRLERDMRSITDYDPMEDALLREAMAEAFGGEILSITRPHGGNGGAL